MKIRNGFVSNSSSSSFIIAINEPKKCPCCGHTPPNILDFISDRNSQVYDTYVGWNDVDDYLDDLKLELENEKEFLQRLSNRSPDEKFYYSSGYQSGTVGSHIRNCKNSIDDLTKQIKKLEELKNQGKQIVCIEVDYHDEFTNSLLNDCVSSGSVTIINERD